MAKIVAEEQKDLAVVPEDTILHLKVEEIKIETVKGNRGDWDKMEIKFKVLGIQATGDGSPVEHYESLITGPIWGGVPFKLTESAENKLRLWTEAILHPVQVGVGFELDTDLFLGRTVRGVTGTYEKRSINPANGRPFLGHKVLSLLPADPNAASAGPSGWGQQPQGQPQQNDPWASPPQPQGGQQQGYAFGQQPGQQQPVAGPPQGQQNDPWASKSWDDEPPF